MIPAAMERARTRAAALELERVDYAVAAERALLAMATPMVPRITTKRMEATTQV